MTEVINDWILPDVDLPEILLSMYNVRIIKYKRAVQLINSKINQL